MTELAAPDLDPLHVPAWAHGRPGRGQGGWCCGELWRIISEADPGGIRTAGPGATISVALRRPIALDVDLAIRVLGTPNDRAWQVVDAGPTAPHATAPRATAPQSTAPQATAPEAPGVTTPGVVVLEAVPAVIEPVATEPIDVAVAADARRRFDRTGDDHVAATCFSCGTEVESMRVWPVALGDGRVATDWTPTTAHADDTGRVDERLIWTALDCTSGFYTGEPDPTGVAQHGVTVQYGVRVLGEVRADETYVLIGHSGRYDPRWDGRKRGAGASLFDARGDLVAYADSFWIALPD